VKRVEYSDSLIRSTIASAHRIGYQLQHYELGVQPTLRPKSYVDYKLFALEQIRSYVEDMATTSRSGRIRGEARACLQDPSNIYLQWLRLRPLSNHFLDRLMERNFRHYFYVKLREVKQAILEGRDESSEKRGI